MKQLALLAFLPLAVAACSQPAAQAPATPAAQAATMTCPPGIGPAIRFELQLGGSVAAKDFNTFIDAEVTPRFPRGVTVVESRTQSQEENGAISREESRILIVVVPPSLTATAYIGAIASAYDERFDQDSALVSEANVCGGYIGTELPD